MRRVRRGGRSACWSWAAATAGSCSPLLAPRGRRHRRRRLGRDAGRDCAARPRRGDCVAPDRAHGRARARLRGRLRHRPLPVLADHLRHATTGRRRAAVRWRAAGRCARAARFVVDAFVPRPVAASAEFSLDYRRPYDGGFLVRSKRITPLSDGRNRIERRYEVVTAAGRTVDCVEVSEEIRPVSPEELVAALERRASGWSGPGGTTARVPRLRRAVLHGGRAGAVTRGAASGAGMRGVR